MSLFSGAGGDDRLQVGMAVFAVVMSLTVTLMIPIVAPAYDTDTGYSYADIYIEKASVESYTGESMTNMTPWSLTGVYTPWAQGMAVNTDPETGWVYGESVTYTHSGYSGTTSLGDTTGIYLDPDKKSSIPLSQADTTTTTTEQVKNTVWWAMNPIIPGTLNLFGDLAYLIDEDSVYEYSMETKTVDVTYWNYIGYRYEFDPMLKIDWTDPTTVTDSSKQYATSAQSDAKLSIVWYENDYLGQGLSNGLILYNNTTNGLVYNLTLSEILDNYKLTTGYSTKYALDFNGVNVYLNIRFDQDVISGSVDLTEAFNDGRWTLAVTAQSMDNYMNISSSNSLSNSAANILDTYISIFTLSLPSVPFVWSMVLWVVCILPLDLTVLMFLSRFGIAGVAVGILGNVLLACFGLAG